MLVCMMICLSSKKNNQSKLELMCFSSLIRLDLDPRAFGALIGPSTGQAVRKLSMDTGISFLSLFHLFRCPAR